MARSRVLVADVSGQLADDKDATSAFLPLRDRLTTVFPNVNIHYRRLGIRVSDFSMRDWVTIARVVHSEYERFDGFVIWHPTDSLAYTGSALSFMFENLAKPVVVSGSILPLGETRSDALQNLLNSIEVAGYASTRLPNIPEVLVCFGNRILRAVRARKISASSFIAFDSPSFPLIGEFGEEIQINQAVLRPIPPATKRFALNDRISEQVLRVDLFPGFDSKHMRDLILQRDLKGIILGSYGAGNIPSDATFLATLAEANTRGKIIISVPNVPHTSPVVYTGEKLLDETGVIRISDLTPEAALTKLAVTLGRGLSLAYTRELLRYDLRGEQSEIEGNVESLWTPPVHTVESAIALVTEINEEVLRSLKMQPKRMYDLSSRTFEKLVAEIFRHHGYQVALTPKTRDGGFDFSALFVDGMGLSFLSYVETKRYSPDNPVGVGVVRALHGVVAASEASRGIIVTSSRFTRDAQAFQSSAMNRLSLHDYNDIKRWLQEFDR